MHWLTIWHRILADFWPLDASRIAPNIVASAAQYVGIAAVAYAVWPHLRHAVNAWLKGHHQSGVAELHAKLDHIIQHSSEIPAFVADAGKVVETVDPSLTPAVDAAEKVASTIEGAAHPQTTMSAR